MLSDIYRGFACLGTPPDAQVVDAIVAEHARGAVAAFLQRHGDDLDGPENESVAYLSRWPRKDVGLADVWCPGFRLAEIALRNEMPDLDKLRVAAAQLALAMAAAGHAGSFRFELEEPVHLCFDRWCLPAVKGISANCERDKLEVALAGEAGEGFRFEKPNGAWRAERLPAEWDSLCRIPFAGNMVTFLTTNVVANGGNAPYPHALATADATLTEIWLQSERLMAAHAPGFLTSIGQVVRDIAPAAVAENAMISGSHQFHWGQIYMAAKVQPLQLAEMLVHESSHQYYFIAGMLGDVHDGSDENLYYSPVKKKHRPLDKILLAYHAFANVVLFYRQCRDAGLNSEAEEAAILPEVEALEKPLRESTALTQIGQALWQPLATRLEETRR